MKTFRVLVADDDAVVRAMICDHLQARATSITEAQDGAQAWDLLLNQTFELALIDLSMPNVDGFTLIQCMRGHPRTRHMPIVVITATDNQATLDRALAVGATSFVTKTCNWSLFGHHINYLLQLGEQASILRGSLQHAEAVSRAKDAVFAMLATRIREHTEAVVQALSDTDLARAGQAASSEALCEAMGHALAIRKVCDTTLPHLRSITEQILFDDRPVTVERLLDLALDEVRDLASVAGVSIHIASFEPNITVRCDQTSMVRAITNLLTNAVLHSGATRVELEVELRKDNELAIAVADAGRGADPAYIAACLRPLGGQGFADLYGSSSGLGLAISAAIARAHGGTAEVITALDQGTTATLILPADIVEIRHEQVEWSGKLDRRGRLGRPVPAVANASDMGMRPG